MAKRKVVTGSGIINTIVNAVNKVAEPQLPFVDKQSFKDFAKTLATAPDSVQNLFLESLSNLGFLQKFVQMREYESYFRRLYGEDILQEQLVLYCVDRIKARSFDPEDTTRFLESHPPRVGSEIIQSVLRRQYQLSTLEDIISAIGQGESYFVTFYDSAVTAMWNSYEYDNLLTIKEMITEQVKEGNLRLFPLAKPTDQTTVLAMKVEVDTITADWESELNRGYNLAGFATHTPESELIYLFNNRIMSLNSNYNLAWSYNKEYLDLKKDGRAISMKSDGLADGAIYAAVFDSAAFEIHNRVGHPRVTGFFNPGTLENERILTCFTIFGMNLFANSIWFIDPTKVGFAASNYATLDTRDGSANANLGEIKEIYVKSVKAATGKYVDKFGKFSITGNTSNDTYIDEDSGELYIAKDEEGTEGTGADAGSYFITVTWTSHLDNTKTATKAIKLNV